MARGGRVALESVSGDALRRCARHTASLKNNIFLSCREYWSKSWVLCKTTRIIKMDWRRWRNF